MKQKYKDSLSEMKVSFKIGSDKESGIIFIQDFYDKACKEISVKYYNTREEEFKKALIKLGWTPPPPCGSQIQ